MGDRGQHFKLGIAGRGGRAAVVAFGWEKAIAAGDDAPLVNVVVDLERNEFRGTVEAQAKLRALAEIKTEISALGRQSSMPPTTCRRSKAAHLCSTPRRPSTAGTIRRSR